jgi:hypothetical protein
MEYRNPEFNEHGTIDCEIEHPDLGWIPFTADPNDVEPLGAEVFNAAKDSAAPYEPAHETDPLTPEQLLAIERAGMICSRLQGRLTLGPETCAALDALAADPDTPWAMRETITGAIEWSRTSQAMDELGYALGYTADEMDALFRIAMTVRV